VVVTDRSGGHRHGLKKEDFVLLEDGKEQKIASFEEIEKPGLAAVVPRKPNQFTNTEVEGRAQSPLTIIVLDQVNTSATEQLVARQQIVKYLSEPRGQPAPTSLFAITRDGVRVLHDFSTDLSAVAASLGKARSENQLVEKASQEALSADPMLFAMMQHEIKTEQRMESIERRAAILITLRSLQQIARSCEGLSGRKALLWATSGFPFSINPLSKVMNIAGVKGDSVEDVHDLYQKTWRLLNHAGVALYPVDVRQLATTTVPDMNIQDPNKDFHDDATWMQDETIGTFRTFAGETGGLALFNTNDLQAAFQAAYDDNASYYLLSYYLIRKHKAPGWHNLGVKVHASGIQVRARSGFFLQREGSAETTDPEMQMALNSPLDYSAIPITGEWKEVTKAKEHGKKKVVFQLTMPANFAMIDNNSSNHMLLEIVAVARSATGETAGEFSKTMDGHLQADSVMQIRNHGMDYRGALTLPPGDYTVRFAVLDRLSGRLGSVAAPLRVEH